MAFLVITVGGIAMFRREVERSLKDGAGLLGVFAFLLWVGSPITDSESLDSVVSIGRIVYLALALVAAYGFYEIAMRALELTILSRFRRLREHAPILIAVPIILLCIRLSTGFFDPISN